MTKEAESTFRKQGWHFESYARITCVRNPYTRLPALFERIKTLDPVWRVRAAFRLSLPSFDHWLTQIQPNGSGGQGSPSQVWRRFGAWSATEWCADRITHVVPIEQVARLMPPILRQLDIPRPEDPHILSAPETQVMRLSDPATKLIATTYAADISAFGYGPAQLDQAA